VISSLSETMFELNLNHFGNCQILTIEGLTNFVILVRNKLKFRVGLKQTLLCQTLVNIERLRVNK